MSSGSDSCHTTNSHAKWLARRKQIKVVITAIPPRPLHAIEKFRFAYSFAGVGAVKGWVNERLVMVEFWVPGLSMAEAIQRAHRHVHNIAGDAELLLAAGPLGGAPEVLLQTPGWPKNPPDLPVLKEEGTLPICSLEPWLVL